ncbi:hypothetical protein NEIRO03_0564 [Nematocida sp. AWRm78]|nr:hypothetical protein NEIRO02_1216 [Nematocida sp. AWRm79]KAI5182924.1 hypothetical protein NEIRO03_0564 [Nematocida sp. AWRm78]
MGSKTDLPCTYCMHNKKRWLDGTLTVTNYRIVLFDSKGKEIDSRRIKGVELGTDSIRMDYHEVLCDGIDRILQEIIDNDDLVATNNNTRNIPDATMQDVIIPDTTIPEHKLCSKVLKIVEDLTVKKQAEDKKYKIEENIKIESKTTNNNTEDQNSSIKSRNDLLDMFM